MVLAFGFGLLHASGQSNMDDWMKVAKGQAKTEQKMEEPEQDGSMSSKIELLTSKGTSTTITDGENKVIFRCYVSKSATNQMNNNGYQFRATAQLPDNDEPTIVFYRTEEVDWSSVTSRGYLDVDFSPSEYDDLKNLLDGYDFKLKGTYTLSAQLTGSKSKVNPIKGVVTTIIVASEGSFQLELKGTAGGYASSESEKEIESFNSGYKSNQINEPSTLQTVADFYESKYNVDVTHVSLSTETYRDSGRTRRMDIYVVHREDADGECGWIGSFIDINTQTGAITNDVPQITEVLSCDAVERISKNVK